VAYAHLVHLNPLPRNTGAVVRRYEKVLIPEMNLGQLARIIRSEFLVDAISATKVQGQPLLAHEVEDEIQRRL
jgi:2-oxoglutarate ferredoxin oxidoreductase subunit alpha